MTCCAKGVVVSTAWSNKISLTTISLILSTIQKQNTTEGDNILNSFIRIYNSAFGFYVYKL